MGLRVDVGVRILGEVEDINRVKHNIFAAIKTFKKKGGKNEKRCLILL